MFSYSKLVNYAAMYEPFTFLKFKLELKPIFGYSFAYVGIQILITVFSYTLNKIFIVILKYCI